MKVIRHWCTFQFVALSSLRACEAIQSKNKYRFWREDIWFVSSFLSILYIDYMRDWIASCLAMTFIGNTLIKRLDCFVPRNDGYMQARNDGYMQAVMTNICKLIMTNK